MPPTSTKKSPKAPAKKAPKVAAKKAPKVAVKKAPKVAAKKAPKVAAKKAPKVAAKKAPKVVLKKAPRVGAKTAPKVAPKKAPKVEAKKAPKTAGNKKATATAQKAPKAGGKKAATAAAGKPPKAVVHKPAKAAVVKSPKSTAPTSPRASVMTSNRAAEPKSPTPPSMAATAPKKGLEEFQRVSNETAAEIMQILCKQYPNAQCELLHQNPYQLLIAVILSAQTTDANVNKVTPQLFRRFPTAKALAEAPIDEVKNIIRSTGYYNAKSQNIQACAQALVTRFGGEVPNNIEDLTNLPGVGRKTANVVLGVAFNVPGWTVDTHVQRLSYRLGFSEESDPAKIETDLQKLFPEADWTKYSITLIWHGRRCCFARNPNCAGCPVNRLCPSSLV